jgi:hypothetical protein
VERSEQPKGPPTKSHSITSSALGDQHRGYFRTERFGGLQIDDRLISEKRDLSPRTGSRTTIAAGAPASLL